MEKLESQDSGEDNSVEPQIPFEERIAHTSLTGMINKKK
jgi:hypothetical protein